MYYCTKDIVLSNVFMENVANLSKWGVSFDETKLYFLNKLKVEVPQNGTTNYNINFFYLLSKFETFLLLEIIMCVITLYEMRINTWCMFLNIGIENTNLMMSKTFSKNIDVTKVICPPLYSKTMTWESDADILPNDIL